MKVKITLRNGSSEVFTCKSSHFDSLYEFIERCGNNDIKEISLTSDFTDKEIRLVDLNGSFKIVLN